MTPEEIRRHATDLILSHARGVEFLSISEHLGDLELSEVEHDEACWEINDLIRKATVTVELPAETVESPEESAAIVDANLRAAGSVGLGG